jgi:hypothetical protein
MNRVLVALPLAAVLVAAAWPASRAQGFPPGVCEQMTTARMLENPGLASEYAQALRSGDAAEIARVHGLLEHIRTAHGCAGEAALPEAAPAPRLPPGHPPIAPGERPSGAIRPDGPGVVTI